MLVLVRHGRTVANSARKLQGLLDLPLDEEGLAQVAGIAEWLDKPDRVISSPLVRARQTAEAFGMPYELDERWVELDYGASTACRSPTSTPRCGREWRVDPTYRAGGGESMEAMSKRVVAAAEELIDDARASVDRRRQSRLTDQGRCGVGARRRCDGWVGDASRSGIRLPNLCGPAGPVLLGYNETRRTQTSWRPIP